MEENKAPNLTTPKKISKTVWWILGIVVFFILLAIGNSNNNQSNPSPADDTANTPINSVCSDLNSVKSNAKNISFAELNKDPNSFNGTDAKFTGQIVQIQESNGQGYIRLDITKDPVLGWSGTDIIYVTYTGHNDFVQNDIVTVYGVLQGSYTYTSQSNYQITLPSMEACSVEKPITQKISKTSASTNVPTNNTTAVTTPTSPPALVVPKTWHTVTTYSNNINTQTPPFSMQGSQWRVSYTCTITDLTYASIGNFNGAIYSTSDGSIANDFASDVSCPTSNTSYVYAQTPGQYYLDLEPGNATYTVTVEDYY